MKLNNRLMFLFLVLSVFFITVSYSAFNTSLYVSGSGVFRAHADVRVVGIVNSGYHGDAIENFNPNYNVDVTNVSVDLPTSASYMTYTVTIKNYGDEVYIPQIEVLSEVSNNVNVAITDGTTSYNLPNNNINYKLETNEEKTYTITISNKNNTTNNDILVSLKYHFVIDEVTSPIIALSSNEQNIELVSAGTSTFNVNNYEYFVSQSNITPSDSATATGTTNGTLSLSEINYGHYYVWYRTISTKGTKSSWSNSVEVNRIYTITLNNQSATTTGTTVIYEYYSNGYYLDNNLTNQMTTSTNNITVPTKTGYTFNGYYTGTNGTGTQYIDENGNITSSASNTNFTSNGTLYAYWEEETNNLYTFRRLQGDFFTWDVKKKELYPNPLVDNGDGSYTFQTSTYGPSGITFKKSVDEDNVVHLMANKRYIFSFDIVRVPGEATSEALTDIAVTGTGHVLNSYKIDDVEVSNAASSGNLGTPETDSNYQVHHVEYDFTTTSNSNKIFIYPNRRDGGKNAGSSTKVMVNNFHAFVVIEETTKQYDTKYTAGELEFLDDTEYLREGYWIYMGDWYADINFTNIITTNDNFNTSNATFNNDETIANIYAKMLPKNSVPVYCVLDAGSSGISFKSKTNATSYQIDNSPNDPSTYSNSNSVTLGLGRYYGHVKDNSNNKYTCKIEITEKVQNGYVCSATGSEYGYRGSCDCWSGDNYATAEWTYGIDAFSLSSTSCNDWCQNQSSYGGGTGTLSQYYMCPDNTIQDNNRCKKRTSNSINCPTGYANLQPYYTCASGTTEITYTDYCYNY